MHNKYLHSTYRYLFVRKYLPYYYSISTYYDEHLLRWDSLEFRPTLWSIYMAWNTSHYELWGKNQYLLILLSFNGFQILVDCNVDSPTDLTLSHIIHDSQFIIITINYQCNLVKVCRKVSKLRERFEFIVSIREEDKMVMLVKDVKPKLSFEVVIRVFWSGLNLD